MINKGLFTSNTDLWATPIDFYNKLDSEFNFTLDPCANEENHKCEKYFTKEDDGLSKNWDNEIVFCNPPYGRVLRDWVKKASEARGGSSTLSTSSYGYLLLSRLYLSQSRDPFYQRTAKVWRQQKLRPFPVYVSNL